MIFTLFGALCGAVLGFLVGAALRGTGGLAEGLVVLVCGATGAVVGAIGGAAQAIVDAVSRLGRQQLRGRPGPQQTPESR
jgi:hypothetical protein